jgi:phytoene dehydrogenase-like protein
MMRGRLPRVAVVGAGVAGLRCAVELRRAGVDVTVVEGSDRVGGRIATDSVDGFRLDRGFQLLLTSYPEAQRTLSLERLGLGAFKRGALVQRGGRLRRLADPSQEPSGVFSGMRSRLASPADAIRLLRLRRRLAGASAQALLRAPERPTLDALAATGLSWRLRDGFLEPFLAGVFSDAWLGTSSRLMDVYLRSFALGDAALPAGGMDAIPGQLAAHLPERSIRLDSPVARVDPELVELRSGDAIEADAVVLATDGVSAADLDPSVPVEPWAPLACLYFDAPEPPVEGPWLVLDGDRTGPVNHLCVPSEVARGYAPRGRALVSATVLSPAEDDERALRDSVLAQLEGWFGPGVSRWRHLRTYSIPHAVPFRPPGTLTPGGRPAQLPSGVFCCGDHRDTPSIQGALFSGGRVAKVVARSLATSAAAR